MKTLIGFILLTFSLVAQADVDATFRKQNAVVLYEFRETTGDVIDTADAKFGAPLNLKIMYPQSVQRQPGMLQISEPNMIRSLTNADKITNACKAGDGMTVEVILENAESVQLRAGFDQATNGRPHPLRIVSLANDLSTRNFVLGQFYQDGNIFMVGVNTTGNENNTQNKGNSLRDPLVSQPAGFMLPNPDVAPGGTNQQKVIFTLNSSGVGKLYLSDRNGTLYLAETKTTGFGGGFTGWRSGAYFSLGNNYIPDSGVSSAFALPSNHAALFPVDATSRSNPNRYWKGKLYLVAVYCRELTQQQVFGSAYQVIEYKAFDIPTNFSVTEQLKKAQKIYQRVTGANTPITNPLLKDMETRLNAKDPIGAAALATEQSEFYNITLRDFAAKMSNRDETINVPLNDFTATIIGGVHDNMNFKNLLSDDIVYYADPTKAAVPSDWMNDMLRSNNHYEALGEMHFDLSKVLKPSKQKLFDGTKVVDNPTPAGLLTTRQWMAAHAIAGTNRRLVEFSLKQFLCTPIEKAADSTGPDNVVGRDIDRFPGGSHTKFTTTCRACHTVLDGFRPAFARYTFSNGFVKHALVVPSLRPNSNEDTAMGMEQSPAYVAYKYNKNTEVFPGGTAVNDDSWTNNANLGANATQFGWTKLSGKGPKDFGTAIAESKRFPSCMAERVFRALCKRDVSSADQSLIDSAAKEFSENRSFNLKYLFQRIGTAPECLGE